jgi:hypothetical protein
VNGLEVLGTTLAGILTLAIFSFLYKDNAFYRFAEHLFVGVAAGYYVAIQFRNVFVPNLWEPLKAGDLWSYVPLVLGLLLFARLVPKTAWLSRWPMGAMIGAYAGLSLIGFLQGDLIEQVRANLLSLNVRDAAGDYMAYANFNNFLLIVGVLSTLIYFFFSLEHKGAVGVISKIGIYFLMISFGASYGFTVMARISLLIGRLEFLFKDWPAAFFGRGLLP